MNRLLWISLIIAFAFAVTSEAASCKGELPCTSKDARFQLDSKECRKRTDCCWDPPNEKTGKPGNCIFTGNVKYKENKDKSSSNEQTNAFGNFKTLQEKIDGKSDERSLAFPGLPGCPVIKEFPMTCKLRTNLPYVLEPPLNIPYCQRIPCSLDKHRQSLYDKSLGACGRQPGCYFDKALYEYRKYNIPVMPGVPVCHFAIRNEEFHKYAAKVVDFNGEWNPFFTYCIIEILRSMEDTRCGCEMLKVLDVFGIPPKMAGWGTINRFQCYLIGGCWRSGRGCFYPASLSKVLVKSGQRFKYNSREIIFGRPKCQHFAKSPPMKALESYHKCLIAGCSIDTNVLAGYYSNLFEIGNEMNPTMHWKYWESVTKGETGSYNLERIDVYYPRGKKGKPTPPPPTTNNPFGNIFSGIGNIFNPKPGNTLSCGPPYKMTGGRPCPPRPFPNPFTQLYCPYKVVAFPKFPKLTGSNEGCCDINACYLPRDEIREMHSGASYYYSEWSYYSPCTASCGWGTQTRTRQCVSIYKHKCQDKLIETRKCKAEDCGKWTSWGPYTPCWTCGGVKTKKRICMPPGSYCKGESEEVARCPPCFGR